MNATMEKVFALYNRPGSEGEKAAAREALKRLGLDSCYFADYPEFAPKSTRSRKFRPDQVITLLIANPKKRGSAAYERYEAYRTGMTVAEAKAAGLRSEDFIWDVNHGHITIQ